MVCYSLVRNFLIGCEPMRAVGTQQQPIFNTLRTYGTLSAD